MTQESHDPAGPAWLDTHRFSWTRFVCREGENRFEAFDYESLRFLQVHVHDAAGPVLLRDVGVRRRSYPWPKPPSFACAEPRLQRVFEASFNTLVNAAQETIVDGMGRERQQYSGDGAHQLHATRLVCGDRQLARRFLRTYPMGQTLDGFFLDCWPAFDRLNRIAQRQVGATPWGPLLDHGVTLVYDAWRHYQETGETDLPARALPALRPLRRLPPRAAREGRPAAGRGLGRARGVDRQLLPPAAPEAVRLQPVHRRDPEDGPRADRRAVRATRPARSASRPPADALLAAATAPLLEPASGGSS